ncbi:LuxR C-terminal-related transcriptional regulator [Amycolatopsis speibonae]|uniref:LuxR C-terminal-related transcriptional regulator n=1 Tax=Amycolatopsis speibonae TaxID=1450224 RepID=A0ABV7P3X2_9PSEU
MVYGLPGCGKTAVLEAASRFLAEKGTPVLAVSFPATLPDWDLFGIRALLMAVREQYDDFATDSRLPAALESVSRLCTEEDYADSWRRFCLLHAVGTMFTRLSRTARVTVVLDGVDNLPDPVPAVMAIHRAGHAVIASCRTWSAAPPDLFDGVTVVSKVELGPLPHDDSSALLRRVLNAPVSPRAEQTFREALGPMWGNPSAVLLTAAELCEIRGLEVVDGLACLRAPDAPIALPSEHSIYQVLEPYEELGKHLILLATSPTGLYVEDMPLLAKEGFRTKGAGRAVDAFVRAGLFECEASGRIRCRVPAFGTGVVRGAAGDTRQRLRSGMARRLLVNEKAADHQPAMLARSIAAAGRALSRRSELVDVLRAAECSLPADSPARTAYLYAAWWHADRGLHRTERLRELIRHLVRIADYATLTTIVIEVSNDGPADGARDALAFSAFMSAVHLGRPVPSNVRDLLNHEGRFPMTLDLADRWFAGERIGSDELADCLLPVWRQLSFAAPRDGLRFGRVGRLDVRLADACAAGDLVPVLRAVLGRDYCVPISGPLATYSRALAAHAEGRWDEALDAVHGLELQDKVDERSREHTRLLAAEMYGWLGQDRQAVAWLAKVAENGHFPLLRAWVESGLRRRSGDLREAFEGGWRVWSTDSATGDEIGAARLLFRLAWFAQRLDGQVSCGAIAASAEAWHGRQRSRRSSEVLTLVRGLAIGDETGIRRLEEHARKQGDRHGLVLLSEAAAARTSDCPEIWLREANERLRIGAAKTGITTKSALDSRKITDVVKVDDRGQLSETELEIVGLIRGGRTNRQIAKAVRISEKTVERYLTRLYSKAGCRTRHGLAMSGLARQQDAIGA